mmetsp:Transcript_42392/g.40633  ORF Transcript_42392/g.40633 Transcript_42392/m.40633 type:complete len:120 (-) Transcript_42392:501-860(-)
MESIVADSNQGIPSILISLLGIRELNSRKQITFWKEFFSTIGKIEDEALRKEKLRHFEPIVIRLLQTIVDIVEPDVDVFSDFNKKKRSNEDFDDFFEMRRDFGKLIQYICRCCGPETIY